MSKKKKTAKKKTTKKEDWNKRVDAVFERLETYKQIYQEQRVPKATAAKVIDAFMKEGFRLVDVGAGDLVWQIEYDDGTSVSVLGEGHPVSLVRTLKYANIEIKQDHSGVSFTTPSLKLFLESYRDFNLNRVSP